MPKKSRRMAVRQAELGQRKRRAAKHPSGDVAHAPTTQVIAATQVDVQRGAPPLEAPPVQSIPVRATPERPALAAAPRISNPYILPEIKRIGVITGLVLAILAVFTVILR